jgi:hypothetical protein
VRFLVLLSLLAAFHSSVSLKLTFFFLTQNMFCLCNIRTSSVTSASSYTMSSRTPLAADRHTSRLSGASSPCSTPLDPTVNSTALESLSQSVLQSGALCEMCWSTPWDATLPV